MNLSSTKSARLPSLDGWRALSIVLVLGSHCKVVAGFPTWIDPLFGWWFDGGLGVRFFFVISGFLITHLLLREHDQVGAVDLRRFYIRRALRILPVYFCFLLAALLLQWFTPWHQSLERWGANLTFTTNFFERSWLTGHLWSLAVEEQFYLLWPAALVLFFLPRGFQSALLALTLPILLAPLFRVVNYLEVAPPAFRSLFGQFSFFLFFDSLAIGCAAAIFLSNYGPWLGQQLFRFKNTVTFLGTGCIFFPHLLRKLFLFGLFTVPLGNTMQAVGFALLLLQSIVLPERFAFLNWRFIQHIGLLSYSIYIWQQVFCSTPKSFALPDNPLMSFPGWLLSTYVVACISYYGLEKPFLGLRSRFRAAQ